MEHAPFQGVECVLLVWTHEAFKSVSIQLSFPSWEALLHLNPMMPNVMKRLNPQAQERWQEEVKQAASQFEGAGGLSVPAELLLGVGTK